MIIPPGEEIELEVEYEGRIDEDIYQVNIPDDEFFSPAARYSQKENYVDAGLSCRVGSRCLYRK